MAIPFLLFFVLPVLGLVVFLWCCLCFKVGSWIVMGLWPRRRRPVPEYVRYMPPPQATCRMRRGSGGRAFLMLLVVGLVIFGFSSLSHNRHVQRTRAVMERQQAKVQRQLRRHTPPRPAAPAPPQLVGIARPPEPEVEEVVVQTDESADEAKAGWVRGYGPTVEDATQDAYDKAYGKALALLHENLPGLEWTPPHKYVKEHLVKEMHRGPSKDIEGVGRAHQLSLHVEVTAKDTADIITQDRHYRTEGRLFLLAKLLGGVVLLLSTVAAYIRLDEYSKGFYTGWLRLAGVVAVAAVGLLLLIA